LSVGKNDLPVGKNNLSVGKNDLPVGKNNLSVGKNDLPVGKNNLSVGKNDLSVGKNDLSVGKNNLSVGRNISLGGRYAPEKTDIKRQIMPKTTGRMPGARTGQLAMAKQSGFAGLQGTDGERAHSING
jgi:hypothetical protein